MATQRFDDKIVIVTGASSGIGSATAILFSNLGAQVVLCGRNADNLQKVANDCKGPKPLIVVSDLSKEKDVERIIQETIKTYSTIDVLINNAGILERGTIESTSLEQYDTVMNVNMRAIYQLTMLAVPYLVKSKGCIVNVSSVNGLRSFPGVLAYNISKAALDQFTRCVALELAPKQVRVNSVNPGVIVTEIHKRSGLDDDAYDKFLEHSKTTHALGRTGTCDEVAGTILFLASDTSSFITGATIPVDGGRHAMCPR